MTFPALPKWPAIVVVGENVTEKQAAEIIVRTNGGFYFSCNDQDWEKMLYEVLNVQVKDDWPRANYEDIQLAEGVYSSLPIDYLRNDRIASCYIGGPNGWCDWDGTIGVNNKNIGKWPDCEEIIEEWRTIATAFPFLKLQCQLFDKEHCEDDPKVLIQFDVANGHVNYKLTDIKQFDVGEHVSSASLFGLFDNPLKERGCTIEQFKEALRII